MANNLAYLEFRLSGGSSNSDPDLSLGGIMSSVRILSKSATGLSNVTGVTIDDAPGTTNGAGTLAFTAAGQTLTWTPNGGTAGAATAVGDGGKFAIPGSSGHLLVTVSSGSLPVSNKSDVITVTALSNRLFDDIVKLECYEGAIDYRCFYIVNKHPTDPFYGCDVYISGQPVGADDLELAADLAGIGDGASTGVADTVATETTAPSPSLTFVAPIIIDNAIAIGLLASDEACAIWVKRTVPALTYTSSTDDTSSISVRIGV